MKVKDLIEELKGWDEDTLVVISGYEGVRNKDSSVSN